MASTTKAGKNIQFMHQNNSFGCAAFRAVTNDDTDVMQDALDSVNMRLDQFVLSDQELENLMRGVTDSGELELTSWEGYYVSDPLPNGDKYALFVLSANNGVYWALESQLMGDFKSYEVAYQLLTDGTLRFSTAAGDVVLNFSRDYDLDKGTVSVGSFKGTVGADSIAGAHALPPWPPTDDTTLSAEGVHRPKHERHQKPTPPATTGGDFSVEEDQWWNDDGVVATLAVLTLIGAIGNFIQFVLWTRDAKKYNDRRNHSIEMKEIMTRDQTLALAVAGARVKVPEVDWRAGGDGFTTGTEQKLNSSLHDRVPPVDWSTADPLTVVESLREQARTALRNQLDTFALRRTTESVLDQTNDYDMFPDHLRWAQDLARGHSNVQTETKWGTFDVIAHPDVFDSIIRNVVFEDRRKFYADNYAAAQASLPAATKERNDALQRQRDVENAFADIERKIQKDIADKNKPQEDIDTARREELRKELDDRTHEAEGAQREVDRLNDASQDAADKRDTSERDADRASHEWSTFRNDHGI